MRVLITGGAGFIGLHTARALTARGDEVVVLDAMTQPVHLPGAPPALAEGAAFIQGDVRDHDAWVRALHGVDAVLHLAAYQDYGMDFSRFLSVNAAGTALAVEVIVSQRLPVRRFVYASSQAVYGEGLVRCGTHGVVPAAQRTPEALARGDWAARCSRCADPADPVPMSEDVAHPHNAYGISKLAGESCALTLGAQHGIEAVALRYAIVHGPEQSPRNAYSGLLRSACLALRQGRSPVVFEDGMQVRDYVAIDDVVSANLIALDHAGAPGRVFNVGGARSWTVLEVLEELNRIVDEPREPDVPGLYRVGDVRHTIADTSALRGLGWEPGTDPRLTWEAYWSWLGTQDLPGDVAAEALSRMRESGILRSSGS